MEGTVAKEEAGFPGLKARDENHHSLRQPVQGGAMPTSQGTELSRAEQGAQQRLGQHEAAGGCNGWCWPRKGSAHNRILGFAEPRT